MEEPIKCCICGLEILKKERVNREHEPSLSRGGTKNGWKPAHFICNCVKGNLTMPEFKLVAEAKYTLALRWHIKHREKQVIKRVLRCCFQNKEKQR